MTTFIRTNGYGLRPHALLADPFVNHFFGEARVAAPEIRLDVEETTEAFLVRADLPGIAKDQIQVEINDDIVAIGVDFKRVTTTDAKVLKSERTRGEAQRTIRLPASVDATKADAKHVDGVLVLTLPNQAPTA
jgi:HSP20 family protein